MSNNLVELAQRRGRRQREPERVGKPPAEEPKLEPEPGPGRQTVSVRYRPQVGTKLVVEPGTDVS